MGGYLIICLIPDLMLQQQYSENHNERKWAIVPKIEQLSTPF